MKRFPHDFGALEVKLAIVDMGLNIPHFSQEETIEVLKNCEHRISDVGIEVLIGARWGGRWMKLLGEDLACDVMSARYQSIDDAIARCMYGARVCFDPPRFCVIDCTTDG